MAAAAFGRLTRALSVLSGLLVLGIVLVVMVDVVGRTFFNWPLPGGTVLATLLLVCVIFLGLANVQRMHEHYRVDLVANLLPARVQQVIDVFAHLVGLAVVSLLAGLSAKQAAHSFQRGEVSFDLVPFPIWPARMVLAFGLALLAVQLAVDVVRSIHALARPATAASACAGEGGREGVAAETS